VGDASSPLSAWESFYVIIGSSAAALTGLQFVVTVLGAELNVLGGMPATRAFGTPTIVHFCAVLFIAAILSAPWPVLSSPALGLGACGLLGLAYAVTVVRQARRQTSYRPVFEDWLWHGAFPLIAYAALLAAAVELRRHSAPSLFVIGATALFLLFIGIHNAWDAVTYLAVEKRQKPEEPEEPEEPAVADQG
jgi:hypothetical protein